MAAPESSHSSTYEELAAMTAFAVGLQEGVEDGCRSLRKALLHETVVAGSNELAYTDTRLFCRSALRSRLLRIRALR